MESFRWDPCFETGIAFVDEQHRRLVDLINAFGDCLIRREETSHDRLGALFGEVVAYARYHFDAEEAFMSEVGVDPRVLRDQARSHGEYVSEMVRMQKVNNPGDHESASALHRFLIHWLAHHILGSDQQMARQVRAIRAGIPATEAYAHSQPSSDGATDPLLRALDGLFQEVSARNRELTRLNQALEAKVAERTRALTDALKQLDDIAHRDALTGLPNRRHALRSFEAEWRSSEDRGTSLACMMIDADHFKEVNDTAGHDAGDEVLRRLARCLQHHVRTDDTVCRLGGDEFLILCPRTSLEGALRLAEQVRAAVASLRVRAGSSTWVGSVSVGVAARRAGMASVEDLLKVADEGVYVAKRRGRGCVATILPRGSVSTPPSLRAAPH